MFPFSFQTYFSLFCLISDCLTGVLVSELLLFARKKVNPLENTKQIPGVIDFKAVCAGYPSHDTVESITALGC